MASDWVKAQLTDPLSDVEPQRENRNHSFVTSHKKNPYPKFCRYCGHIPLGNWISRLVTKLGCGYESDQRFQEWRRTKRAPAGEA